MEVSNPRHVLAVSLEGESDQLCRVIKDLTGTAPEPVSTTIAGITHDLALKTAYYTATVPIWLDLISSPVEWAESFLSEEAQEVLSALGGVILVFALPSAATEQQVRGLVRHFGRVVKDGLGGWEWDGVGLAVGMGEGETELWEELCAEAGLEFVQVTGREQGRNEFGEPTGIARVKEALEANDWAQVNTSALSDFGDFEEARSQSGDEDFGPELDSENLDFGFDRADFVGMRKSIWNPGDNATGVRPDEEKKMTGGLKGLTSEPVDEALRQATQIENDSSEELDDDDVAKVEKMMRKLQAAREAGEGMGEEQRRRMAARAVAEVMKEL